MVIFKTYILSGIFILAFRLLTVINTFWWIPFSACKCTQMYLSKLHNYINSHCHYAITMPLMHFIVLSWNFSLCHQTNFYSHAYSTFRHLKMGDVDRPKGLLYIQFVIVLCIAKCLLITFLRACICLYTYVYMCVWCTCMHILVIQNWKKHRMWLHSNVWLGSCSPCLTYLAAVCHDQSWFSSFCQHGGQSK